VSKIYETLRQLKRPYRCEQSAALDAARSPQPVDEFLVANRDMQTLHRSIERLIAQIPGAPMIMFSSAQPGEGKTTVCGSFAAMLAQSFGKSVLILDGDRNHVLSRRFGSRGDAMVALLAKSPGGPLPGAIRVGARGSIAAVPITSLDGADNGDSPELEIIASIKDRLAATFDYILIDSPPLAYASWSASIGPMTDGVILVIEAERTRWPVALNAKRGFEDGGAKVLGVFLNKRRLYIPRQIYSNV